VGNIALAPNSGITASYMSRTELVTITGQNAYVSLASGTYPIGPVGAVIMLSQVSAIGEELVGEVIDRRRAWGMRLPDDHKALIKQSTPELLNPHYNEEEAEFQSWYDTVADVPSLKNLSEDDFRRLFQSSRSKLT